MRSASFTESDLAELDLEGTTRPCSWTRFGSKSAMTSWPTTGSLAGHRVRGPRHKEILRMWIEQTEGTKFWLRLMTELCKRGTKEILIAVVDRLKGLC